MKAGSVRKTNNPGRGKPEMPLGGQGAKLEQVHWHLRSLELSGLRFAALNQTDTSIEVVSSVRLAYKDGPLSQMQPLGMWNHGVQCTFMGKQPGASPPSHLQASGQLL